ncbi:MAG: hypothetical protein HKN50_01045 [Gammaproteobacteria bacterium]|nr:hypothetical protein [Gammaproteobacteria bacterium]
MIRLIIPVLGLILIWLLFFSGFSKQRRILISLTLVLLTGAGLWWEQAGKTPRADLMPLSQLQACGASGQHSYRTNFDIEFCLLNASENFIVKRVSLDFIALQCDAGRCAELQRISRDVAIELLPFAQTTLVENLRFEAVSPSSNEVVWNVEPTAVKAVVQ